EDVAGAVTRHLTVPIVCRRWPAVAFVLIAWLSAAVVAAADDPDTATPSIPPANKLTVAYYDFSSGTNGIDVNLRHTFKSTTGWVGYYHQNDRFDQGRVGYEYDYHAGWLTFVPSVQGATHGFVGFTLYGEAGRGVYAIGGMGRTNLKPYWNLGFDPNDFF